MIGVAIKEKHATGNTMKSDSFPGSPYPLGASYGETYTQFALYSHSAHSVVLELYENEADQSPACQINLDPDQNRTGDIWHIAVRGIRPGQLYAYSIDEMHTGLLDPYAKAVAWPAMGPPLPGPLCKRDHYHLGKQRPKSVVVADNFDWENDALPNTPWKDTILYEVHVRGFSIHPSAKAKHPGTFRALGERASYFKELGITALELLPVYESPDFQFNRNHPDQWVANYWGYNTLSFFAPKSTYASAMTHGEQVNEFKQMVKCLHCNGIEVILDVVFNHTCEGDELGPLLSYRGIDNQTYYLLDPDGGYCNFSGCGNTLNTNHPVVQDLILTSLRYWAETMHVDGFRFDLAGVFFRGQDGQPLQRSPVLERIQSDPILRCRKLIAEPWDAAGLYQLGWFPGTVWREWNDRFRIDIRRFWNTNRSSLSDYATRLCGSSDLFEKPRKSPLNSINYITTHDGFTLHDLVSYAEKHNQANAEDNRDGLNENSSSNFGIEGPTKVPDICALRERQMKNLLVTLFLSQGVPMLLGGDEFKRSQKGNNNAYCQDNPVSWFDWGLCRREVDFRDFVKDLIIFRKRHPVLRADHYFSSPDPANAPTPTIEWYNANLQPPAWDNPQTSAVALLFRSSKQNSFVDQDIFIIFNRGHGFDQRLPTGAWHRAVDTYLPNHECISKPGKEVRITGQTYFVQPSSTVVMVS